MHLKRLELNGFKSFAKKSEFVFDVPIIAIVGPNGSGKSNVVEAIRFVLGEQSIKSMRGKTGSDLIFKGSKDISKMSRASVSIVFDNTDRVFNLQEHNNQKISVDFDEIVISREVFADGGNTYMINGHEVRMKDVHELIGSVNIGASGHHIISQGEADRYLNANVKDRRELVEEALGLKVYQYRLKESQRKLEKAEANMRESELLRRELAPHLRFLKRQVDKIEKAKGLREELDGKYKDYFAQEDYLIKTIESKLDADRAKLQSEYDKVQQFLSAYNPANTVYPEQASMQEIDTRMQSLAQDLMNLGQEEGRVRGMIDLLNRQAQAKPPVPKNAPASFSFHKVESLISKIVQRIDLLNFENIVLVKETLAEIKKEITQFVSSKDETIEEPVEINNDQEIRELKARADEILQEKNTIQEKQAELTTQLNELRTTLETKRQNEREEEKVYYQHLAEKKELDGKRAMLSSRDEMLGQRVQARTEEREEAKVLLGEQALEYQALAIAHELDITAQSQEVFRRDLERIKIRLEDMGGGSGAEVVKEFEDTTERDAFLAKEIEDITQSIDSLNTIITDLKKTLDGEFDIGVTKINKQFDRFFKLMFGGGQAKLESAIIKKRRKKSDDQQLELIPEEEENTEYGIDIKVQLPRKKVSDLDMLSGGERSLTSIALLFALSQVNPPPFLVLDETDAALDEANSQRYGDMVESLSEYSQLIVVTHNRETMSRAQTLFGVTLGRDDASTMLSLRLEDATKYAK